MGRNSAIDGGVDVTHSTSVCQGLCSLHKATVLAKQKEALVPRSTTGLL